MTRSILLLFLLSPFFAHSQEDHYSIAREYDRKSCCFQAIEHYLLALKEDRKRWEKADIHESLGNCYNEILDFKNAAIHFKLAHHYDLRDKELYYKIARAYKRDGDYTNAIKWYKKIGRRTQDDDFAKGAIIACTNASSWKQGSAEFIVKRQDELSTPYLDYSPFLLDPLGRTMILSSTRNSTDTLSFTQYRHDLFFSSLGTSGQWSRPELLDTSINKLNDEGVVSMDHKRSVIFLTRCFNEKGWSGCDIFYAYMAGDLKGESFPLGLKKNRRDSTLNYGHPAFSDELQCMVFAAERDGGFGGLDLWLIKYDRTTDAWSEPVNLGPEINTEGDEAFPFLHPDGTLYFSSTGWAGMGGYDIFKAAKTGELAWSGKMNMKYPINSEGDDLGIVFCGTSNGFFSSDRKGGLGRDDIYRFSSSAPHNATSQVPIRDSIVYKELPDAENSLKQIYNTPPHKSLYDLKIAAELEVDPSPNTGSFMVRFKSMDKCELILRIFDTMGKLVYSGSLTCSEGILEKQLELNGVNAGIYYAQLLTTDGKIAASKKFIVQR
jgi:peptidoglycan-associated lipoprotein